MLSTAFRLLVAGGTLFLGFQAVCAAQSDAPVARPEVKPGDRWVYRRTDFWANKVTGSATLRVAFANDKVIQAVLTRGRNETEIDETHTAEWNAIATADGSNFTPHNGHLKFPLVVGASYPAVFENTIPRLGAFRVKHERTAKVVGWEEVTVPAGKFRALKVEVDGSFQRLDTAISGSALTVIWYVPEVKRWVKWTYEDKTFRGRNNWWGIELVEYKVQ
jgi:hypothetical protein